MYCARSWTVQWGMIESEQDELRHLNVRHEKVLMACHLTCSPCPHNNHVWTLNFLHGQTLGDRRRIRFQSISITDGVKCLHLCYFLYSFAWSSVKIYGKTQLDCQKTDSYQYMNICNYPKDEFRQ